MEYCKTTLREVLDSAGPVDADTAWWWVRQMLEGLGHIHAQARGAADRADTRGQDTGCGQGSASFMLRFHPPIRSPAQTPATARPFESRRLPMHPRLTSVMPRCQPHPLIRA